MTASLPEMALGDARIQGILDDASIGHRSAARKINNLMGGLPVTSEKSVRRFRSKRMTADALSDPQPTTSRAPVKGSGGNWRHGIEIDPRLGGTFTTKPRVIVQGHADPEPEEAELLAEFELDPAVWEITAARKSTWQSPGGDWLEARRVSFKRRVAEGQVTTADVEGIMAQYMVTRPWPRKEYTERILMVPSGDLQLGKQEGGGTAATIDRFCRIMDDIAGEIAREGFNTSLILPWMGDCIEGIVSQGSKMLTALDMPITEQVRTYRRLMMHQINMLASLAVKVIIPVVPGNHDETTRVQLMPVTDSWAIEGASAVADWMSGRPEFEHVQFVFPEPGELGITLNVGSDAHPYVVSFTHGHVANRPEGIIPWWKGQAYGRHHAGSADLLVTAHFHHLRVEHTGGRRTWLQIPALDGGSAWFRSKTGEDAPSGIVSVEIAPGEGGWKGLTVHT